MIPKTIHYCWFGRNPKPKLAEKCIKSWKRYCKEYKIIEWNEDNFDISSCPLYVRQAYEHKKWAFVTDYVRLKVVYDHGGVYFDTDVELRKKLNLLMSHRAWFGFESGKYINTGLGFGAEANHPILAEIMEQYTNIPFILDDGACDSTPCPTRNTAVFLKKGLLQNDHMQTLENDILILPTVYLCPINFNSGERQFSNKTISIHHFATSWLGEEYKQFKQKKIKAEKRDKLIHAPNRLLIKLCGQENYEKLKSFLGK